jgi:hypothetical protein
MKDFFGTIFKGMVYVAILAVSSVAGLLKGIWDESDRMARLYEIEWSVAWRNRGIPPPPIYGAMYVIIRIFAFLLELVILTVLFHFLEVVVVRSLRL